MTSDQTLREKLRAYLATQCTGCDDHDSENCAKCAEMTDALLPIIRQHAAAVARNAEPTKSGQYFTESHVAGIFSALKEME